MTHSMARCVPRSHAHDIDTRVVGMLVGKGVTRVPQLVLAKVVGVVRVWHRRIPRALGDVLAGRFMPPRVSRLVYEDG